jgi:hypothetical protein
MNIKDATSTLLVTAALTGLFAGSVCAQDETTTVKTEKVEKKATKKAGKECKKKCGDKHECKAKSECKSNAGCAPKEETK